MEIPQPSPVLILKPGKEQPLRRFHPWVFSGAIARSEGRPADGDVVQVLDSQRNLVAMGHFHEGSIAVKILAFGPTTPDEAFYFQKLSEALRVRRLLQLGDTTAYRLVHGEGDGLPGLVLDYYDGVVVLQAHSVGMHRHRYLIAEALQQLYGNDLRAIYDKSADTLPDRYAASVQNDYLFEKEPVALPHPVRENGNIFLINWETGQKTGFFLDQRDNRALLARYAPGRRVLNAFCYSGGFSVYALRAGAALVHSVDASAKAIALVEENVATNSPHPPGGSFSDLNDKPPLGLWGLHEAFTDDMMKFLKTAEAGPAYDLVVLDPPAFAKSIEARHRAVQGYKRLNAEGIRRLAPGGILFTFSCSQVVDRALFYNTVVAAALEAGRPVRVLHQLSQAPDHPVNAFHPEGSYLKGLVLQVE